MSAYRQMNGAIVAYDEIERLLADESALHWLSPEECADCNALQHLPARRQRVAGRILAKMLVLQQLADSAVMMPASPQQIQVDSRDGLGRRVAPRVSVDGRWLNWSLSISHTGSTVVAALSTDAARPIGVDVTALTPARTTSLALWLTAAEQRVAAGWGSNGAVLVWCLKEAAFKALAEGRHFTPLRWDVSRCIEQFACGTEVAGVPDLATVNACRFHADSNDVPRAGDTAPDGEAVGVPHGSQSFRPPGEPGCGSRSGTPESDLMMTPGHCLESTADVRMLGGCGWMSRPVNVQMWNTGDALACIVQARANEWTILPTDRPSADGRPARTARPRFSELCGC